MATESRSCVPSPSLTPATPPEPALDFPTAEQCRDRLGELASALVVDAGWLVKCLASLHFVVREDADAGDIWAGPYREALCIALDEGHRAHAEIRSAMELTAAVVERVTRAANAARVGGAPRDQRPFSDCETALETAVRDAARMEWLRQREQHHE